MKDRTFDIVDEEAMIHSVDPENRSVTVQVNIVMRDERGNHWEATREVRVKLKRRKLTDGAAK